MGNSFYSSEHKIKDVSISDQSNISFQNCVLDGKFYKQIDVAILSNLTISGIYQNSSENDVSTLTQIVFYNTQHHECDTLTMDTICLKEFTERVYELLIEQKLHLKICLPTSDDSQPIIYLEEEFVLDPIFEKTTQDRFQNLIDSKARQIMKYQGNLVLFNLLDDLKIEFDGEQPILGGEMEV